MFQLVSKFQTINQTELEEILLYDDDLLDITKNNKCKLLEEIVQLKSINLLSVIRKFIISPKEPKCSDKEIGAGGFGRVFEGNFKAIDVAIKKMIKLDYCEFVNISKLQQKKHENIVKFFGYYRGEDVHYLIFERAICDLDHYLTTHKIDKIDKDKILYDVIRGISHIHYFKIMHLDLKPKNILMVARGEKVVACICDFGKSRELLEKCQKTFTQGMAGTMVI